MDEDQCYDVKVFLTLTDNPPCLFVNPQSGVGSIKTTRSDAARPHSGQTTGQAPDSGQMSAHA